MTQAPALPPAGRHARRRKAWPVLCPVAGPTPCQGPHWPWPQPYSQWGQGDTGKGAPDPAGAGKVRTQTLLPWHTAHRRARTWHHPGLSLLQSRRLQGSESQRDTGLTSAPHSGDSTSPPRSLQSCCPQSWPGHHSPSHSPGCTGRSQNTQESTPSPWGPSPPKHAHRELGDPPRGLALSGLLHHGAETRAPTPEPAPPSPGSPGGQGSYASHLSGPQAESAPAAVLA